MDHPVSRLAFLGASGKASGVLRSQLVPYCHRISLSSRYLRYLLIWEFVCLLLDPDLPPQRLWCTGNSSLALSFLPLALDDTTRLAIRS